MTNSFIPPRRTLMGPGPSDVSHRVLAAMARPTIGHLDPQFVRMMDEIKALLQYAFGTANALTIPISAPGCTNLAGKVWRVGLMGQSACRRNVLFFLAAMEAILGRSGAVAAAR